MRLTMGLRDGYIPAVSEQLFGMPGPIHWLAIGVRLPDHILGTRSSLIASVVLLTHGCVPSERALPARALLQPIHHLLVAVDGRSAVEIAFRGTHFLTTWYFMRMNLASPAPMTALLQLILAHPERFVRSEIPCCLQGIWELQLESNAGGHVAIELTLV